jgi:undecaprenyl-diphosphatase
LYLFTPEVVASTFILGGLIILWVERKLKADAPQDLLRGASTEAVSALSLVEQPVSGIQNVDEMTPLDALKVGLVQCLAMIPGTSRSGATIIGGMVLGLSRKAAADFSFYLAIPTLIGAGAYSLYKERALLSLADAPTFAVGLLFSFISAWVCVRWLLRYIASHSFLPFAWYRIVFGIAVWGTAYSGLVAWS